MGDLAVPVGVLVVPEDMLVRAEIRMQALERALRQAIDADEGTVLAEQWQELLEDRWVREWKP